MDMPMMVAGVGTVPTALTETDQVVVTDYQNQVAILQNILDQAPGTLTAADANTVSQAIINLQNLAASGLPATHNNYAGVPTTQTYYMTTDMARQTDLLMRSMMAAGITPGSAITLTQLQKWQDLGVNGVSVVVQRAAQAVDTNRSLQALIETEYVATANNVLATQLTALEAAMSTTQAITVTLTSLQSVRNLVAPENKSGVSLSALPTGVSAAETAYNTAAQSAFGNPINIYVAFGTQNPQDVIAQVATDRAQLAAELTQLDKISPPTIGSTGQAVYTPNSLQAEVSGVLSDMTTYLPIGATSPSDITLSGLEAWIIDNMNQHLPQDSPSAVALAGKIGQTFTAAVAAATNLNDTQKEQFQQYMFIFQEFYQSAGAIMTQINQILATMAQDMGQG